MPRGEVPVGVDEDQQVVGYASAFVQTRDGIWSAVKVGYQGEALVFSKLPHHTVSGASVGPPTG
jgi:hypothetical protein